MEHSYRSIYKKLKKYYIQTEYEYIHFINVLHNKEIEIDFLKVQLFYTHYDNEFIHISKIIDRINFDIYFLKKIIKNYEFMKNYNNTFSYQNDILLYPIIEESNYDLESN
jgi:hypothetical protein